MEGRPRRGRRRRQSPDQAPAPQQGTVSAPEQVHVAPSEDAPPLQAQETTASPSLPQTSDDQTQPSPVAPQAEETSPPTTDQPPSLFLQPAQSPVPQQAPPQSRPAPPSQQPPAAPLRRGEQRPPAHPKPNRPKEQREQGRGEQGREGRGGVQGRGDQGQRPQDGVIAAWSIPVRMDNDIRRIEDMLRGIRKALEEEYMIGQEDASERVLLDLAVNAIRDRITIHRIQPITRDLEETERLLRLRHQADRHVVEMLTALKSA